MRDAQLAAGCRAAPCHGASSGALPRGVERHLAAGRRAVPCRGASSGAVPRDGPRALAELARDPCSWNSSSSTLTGLLPLNPGGPSSAPIRLYVFRVHPCVVGATASPLFIALRKGLGTVTDGTQGVSGKCEAASIVEGMRNKEDGRRCPLVSASGRVSGAGGILGEGELRARSTNRAQ